MVTDWFYWYQQTAQTQPQFKRVFSFFFDVFSYTTGAGLVAISSIAAHYFFDFSLPTSGLRHFLYVIASVFAESKSVDNETDAADCAANSVSVVAHPLICCTVNFRQYFTPYYLYGHKLRSYL